MHIRLPVGRLARLATTIALPACVLAWAPAPVEAGLLGKMVSGAAGKGGKKTYDANTLAPPMLRQCLLTAHKIDVASAELDAKKLKLASDREVLMREARKIKDSGRATEKNVADYRAKEKSFNDNVDAFNSRVNGTKAVQKVFNQDCAGKRYYDSDMSAVLAELPPDVRRAAEQRKH